MDENTAPATIEQILHILGSFELIVTIRILYLKRLNFRCIYVYVCVNIREREREYKRMLPEYKWLDCCSSLFNFSLKLQLLKDFFYTIICFAETGSILNHLYEPQLHSSVRSHSRHFVYTSLVIIVEDFRMTSCRTFGVGAFWSRSCFRTGKTDSATLLWNACS